MSHGSLGSSFIRRQTMSNAPSLTVRRPVALAGVLLSLCGLGAQAGSLTAPGGANGTISAMYTLDDLYNRLITGATGAKRTGSFTEPNSGPTAGTMHTLNAIMAKMPAVDATNGATAADVASGKTFWGLSGGAWGPQTGTAEAFCTRSGSGWPCYLPLGTTGAVVRDLATGLDWQRCSVDQTWNAGTQTCDGTALSYTWDQAMAKWPPTAEWRLPTIAELRTLVYCSTGTPVRIDMTDYSACSGWYVSPTILSWAFPNTPDQPFWSSSPNADYSDKAWVVSFNSGVGYASKGIPFYVRLVRGGQ
jgi:hypothetical protein